MSRLVLRSVAGVDLVDLGDGRLLAEVRRRRARQLPAQLAAIASAARRAQATPPAPA